jgi:hypothetical protein
MIINGSLILFDIDLTKFKYTPAMFATVFYLLLYIFELSAYDSIGWIKKQI